MRSWPRGGRAPSPLVAPSVGMESSDDTKACMPAWVRMADHREMRAVTVACRRCWGVDCALVCANSRRNCAASALHLPPTSIARTTKECCSNCICRQQCTKLGTGRMRHIQGKLLWIQHMTKSGQMKIKAVGTTWNPAGLGTKTPSADRHRMHCYMLNMLSDGDRMGERQYLRATQADWNKQSIKKICNVSFSNSSLTPHVQHNIVKRVVQLVCLSNIGMTQGIVCTTCNVLVSQQALSQLPLHEYDLCLYGTMFMVLMILAGMILYAVMWKIERDHGYTGCHKGSAL